jgi:diguanylate cyclase (GGDEF)-like protein
MTGTYSLELVGLSFVVAVVASYVSFALAAHISATRGWAGTYWLAGGAIAMGAGIWSMHFVGMLAFELPIAMSYDVETTFVSLVIAIVASAFALYVVSHGTPNLINLVAAAVTLGLGIAAMHYTGMAAMNAAPRPSYDAVLVAASIAVAIAASGLALTLGFRLRSDATAKIMGKRLLAALAMGAGICAMHYTGMAAVEFAPGTICTAPNFQIDQFWLAIAVAGMTLLFLAATMLILTVDVRLAYQLDAANRRITLLARQDPLTGVANRRTFMEELEAAFRGRPRNGADFAVLFLDLDGFKEINDTLGHAAGDAMIVEVAERLRRTVRRDDLVARFGGDEFAVLQRNIATPTDAGTLAEKIGEVIAQPFALGHDDVAVTASIGVANVSSETSTPADLMVQADLALYRAKDEGRNCYRFHDSNIDRQVHTRVLLARELKTAIERGELELVYRPQVQIATGRIVGLETRVQWNNPSRGIIGQSVFIPIAERAGCIVAVGAWAIEEACRQMQQWQEHNVAPPTLAIGISRGQFKAGVTLVHEIDACLQRHNIEANCIELEFDEPVLMQAAQRHAPTLQALRDLGLRIAVTEFGNGYSSIGYLAGAPVQRLKLARSLVSTVLTNAASARAVRAGVQVARELGAETVADGVETQGQTVFLLAAGCEQAQGSFFGPALSAMEATLLLRNAILKPAAKTAKRGPSAA